MCVCLCVWVCTYTHLLTVWITTNWKILNKMGMPDLLTCLLRNLYAGQEATVQTRYGPADSVSPQTEVHHVPLSLEFSWQEYWSGLPFPIADDLPDP